jgi:hypothetical protein
MILSAIRTAVRAELLRFGMEQRADFALDYFVNQGGNIFSRESRAIRKTQTTSTVANQEDYTLQTGALEVLQARFNDQVLAITSPEELAGFYPSWPTQAAGTPRAYHLFDAKTIRLFPKPSAAVTNGLKIDLVAGWVTDLAADNDDPETVNGLPARYHLALVYYAAKQIALPQAGGPPDGKGGGQPQGAAAAIADLEARYQQLLEEARSDVARGYTHEFRRVPFKAF